MKQPNQWKPRNRGLWGLVLSVTVLLLVSFCAIFVKNRINSSQNTTSSGDPSAVLQNETVSTGPSGNGSESDAYDSGTAVEKADSEAALPVESVPDPSVNAESIPAETVAIPPVSTQGEPAESVPPSAEATETASAKSESIEAVPDFSEPTEPSPASSSPAETAPIAHIHSFDQLIREIAPTCQTEGVRIWECLCGQVYYERLPLTQHNWFEQTQWQDGTLWNVDYCLICHETRLMPHVHDYVLEQEIAADCTHDGCERYLCREHNCLDVYTVTLPALGHLFDDEASWPLADIPVPAGTQLTTVTPGQTAVPETEAFLSVYPCRQSHCLRCGALAVLEPEFVPVTLGWIACAGTDAEQDGAEHRFYYPDYAAAQEAFLSMGSAPLPCGHLRAHYGSLSCYRLGTAWVRRLPGEDT